MTPPMTLFYNNYQPSPPYQPCIPNPPYQPSRPLYPGIHLPIINNYNYGNNYNYY